MVGHFERSPLRIVLLGNGIFGRRVYPESTCKKSLTNPYGSAFLLPLGDHFRIVLSDCHQTRTSFPKQTAKEAYDERFEWLVEQGCEL